jgi:hypothetical protein
MPTLDSLPAQQRAILELVLKQGKSYSEIAGLLDMPEPRVGSQARDSLGALAPRTAERVDSDWRDQVADYLLGQQTGAAADATRMHISSSEAARTWALSVVDSLGDLYAAGTEPEIPDGGHQPRRARRAASPSPSPKPVAARRATPAGSTGLRRRIVGAVAVSLVIAVTAFALGPGFGPSGGSDDEGIAADSVAGSAASGAETGSDVLPTGALELKPEAGEKGKGVATFLTQDGKPGLLVQAKLQPNAEGQAYEVWLYNDQDDAVSLGAQVTDDKGNYVGTGPLPTNFGSYKYIDISREPIDDDAAHSGDSVLRGSLDDVQAAVTGPGAVPPPSGGTATSP